MPHRHKPNPEFLLGLKEPPGRDRRAARALARGVSAIIRSLRPASSETVYAMAVQRGMTERNAAIAEDQRVTFRISIHQGDIIVTMR